MVRILDGKRLAEKVKIELLAENSELKEKNILLELEDGSEHKLSEDKVFDISSNTFYRVTTEEDKAKYLIALKAA